MDILSIDRFYEAQAQEQAQEQEQAREQEQAQAQVLVARSILGRNFWGNFGTPKNGEGGDSKDACIVI